MNNIYGQDENTRNAIVALPEGFAETAGNTLYAWLGSLWRGLHAGDDLVRGLQTARGLRLAQLYLDILEAARLQDRRGAPVFHRALWHPIAIRKAQRNRAQENLLALGGDDRTIGPQPPGSDYGEGTVFQMGRMANFEQYVTYPLADALAGGALTIVDNPIQPTVVLVRDTDYAIRNNTLVFPKENDPLAADAPFAHDDLPELLADPDGTEHPDVETILWASDVLIDRNYLADHLGYALGANTPSLDVVKRILNAAWSATSSGLTPELIKTLLAALLNVPVIQNAHETVVDIVTERDSDGTVVAQVVQTDHGSYRVSPKATLRRAVRTGAVLTRGDLLDETVRIYPSLNTSAGREGHFSVPLQQDIPSLVLPPALLRARTEYGVYAMWPEVTVRRSAADPGSYARPHLYFDIGGTESDVAAFWADVWADADRRDVSLESVLGPVGTRLSPADFLLRNLVGANALFVVVDRSQADDISLMRNPMFFDMLSDVVPAAVRLFVIEHNAVGGEDRMELGTAKEKTKLTAALPAVKEEMVCGEHVRFRFVRPQPLKVRVRKEET